MYLNRLQGPGLDTVAQLPLLRYVMVTEWLDKRARGSVCQLYGRVHAHHPPWEVLGEGMGSKSGA